MYKEMQDATSLHKDNIRTLTTAHFSHITLRSLQNYN